MKFPIKTVRVGSCLAVASIGNSRLAKGKPRCCNFYSVVIHRNRKWMAHRLSFHLNKKKIPRQASSYKNGIVLHSCDNKWCVNPDHLSLGTASKNKKECWERNQLFRERACKSYSIAAKKRWESQIERDRQSKRTKAIMNRPGMKELISKKITLLWKTASYRDSMKNRRAHK